ncbi:MAG: hypothetical protein KDA93_12840 [Planctomycetaceae bacterium]|nr:hypothetical protein [Planctomycetaceae bacterium]
MKRYITFTSVAFVTLLASMTAKADETTAFNRFDAARKVAQIVMQIAPNERSFFVREFRAPSSNNVGLSKLIGEQLTKENLTVGPGGSTEVEGRLHRLPRDLSKPLTGFSIQGAVFLSNGNERRFTVNVNNRDDGHSAVTDTGETSPSPDTTPGGIAVSDPTIVGTELRPSPSSPYGVEILVESASGQLQPLTPFKDGNLIKVSLKQGDIYAVRVHNRSSFEAAADVLIDGLGRFSLADDVDQRDNRDIILPGSQRTVPGYYRTTELVDSFQIGEYSKSVAAQVLPNPTDVGTVTVTFAAAWKIGENPPPNEPPVAKSLPPVGTVAGPPRKDPTVKVERNIGGIRAVVKLRY